ncbi:hypothetical protein F4553_000648 [Allocatelliglobosispora scoriae]|uniref:Ig-like domain-containing protein n=1 Tax=Allocatelliglobosispora scoriae TaxID=643052 RepID=A0A841BJC2_9ACTN|nr:hypothetical protein [Allocatelliglobosispora scoriae]MBB5867269.1 hypothetical protein [Allocatelliglobosispora scoriae]
MLNSSRSRRIPALLLGLLIAAGGAVATAAPAHAAGPLLVQCAGTEQDTFTPPIRSTQQTITVRVHATLLCPLNGVVTSATLDYTYTHIGLSCTNAGTGGPGSLPIRWSNGQNSTFQFNVDVTLVNGTYVVRKIGFISSGLFTGYNAVRLLPGINPNVGACTSPAGLGASGGATTLTLTGL